MSIYATLWSIQIEHPRGGFAQPVWVTVTAQSVPAHVGSRTLGDYDHDPYADFLPPPIEQDAAGWSSAAPRAVVFVTDETVKRGQRYLDPLMVLTGVEYERMPMGELLDRLRGAVVSRPIPVRRAARNYREDDGAEVSRLRKALAEARGLLGEQWADDFARDWVGAPPPEVEAMHVIDRALATTKDRLERWERVGISVLNQLTVEPNDVEDLVVALRARVTERDTEVSGLREALRAQCPGCVKGPPRDIHSGMPTDYHDYAYNPCKLSPEARSLLGDQGAETEGRDG